MKVCAMSIILNVLNAIREAIKSMDLNSVLRTAHLNAAFAPMSRMLYAKKNIIPNHLLVLIIANTMSAYLALSIAVNAPQL